MNRQQWTVITLLVIGAFTLGWTASRELDAARFVVKTDAGETRAILGHDELGNGFLQILDADDNEIFAVHHDKMIVFGDETTKQRNAPFASAERKSDVDKFEEVVELADSTVLQLLSLEQTTGDLAMRMRETEIKDEMQLLAKERQESIMASRSETDPAKAFALREQADEKQKEIMELLHQLRLLRDNINIEAPRQILTCWNGAQNVTLYTSRDLRSVVSSLKLNAFIEWTGTKTDGRPTLTFVVSAIKPGTKPAGFTMK